MTTRRCIGALATLLIMAATANAATKTVRVDCLKGNSINAALQDRAEVLILQISGVCEENVVVSRERVTLRGVDPGADGIRAASLNTSGGFAVAVRSSYVRIENLMITGGKSVGLNISHSGSYGRLDFAVDWGTEIVNCVFADNPGIGLFAEYSTVSVSDAIFDANALGGAYSYEAALACSNCAFTDNGTLPEDQAEATVTVNRGSVFLGASNIVAASSSGLNVLRGRATVADSSISATGNFAVTGFFESDITLRRSSVIGRMALGQQSHARIDGVTQTSDASGNGGIGLDGGANFIARKFDSFSTSLTGEIGLSGFSNAVLRDDSSVTGNLTCFEGSNVACADPSKVTGTSNCGLCPK